MLEVNAIVNECYILRKQVGEDCFSEWWQASAIFVASNFLLRFIKPEYASSVDHIKEFFDLARRRIPVISPAIVSLIEIDRYQDRFFVASEFDGQINLKSILDSGKHFSVEHSCRLIIELAEGIGTFHQRGDAFGALTPESVAVHRNGDRIDELKLLLPGYQLFFDMVPESRLADIQNTWGYASPELKRGKATDTRSDIYSLGVLLFRLLAGKIPYGSRSSIRVQTKSASPAHVAAVLARKGMPRELTTATVRALRKSPSLRHEDIMIFISELRHILDVRREATIRSGSVDPIADLATLNLQKAKAGAREIVRSLETVDYFRLLSSGGVLDPLAPLKTLSNDEDFEKLEELEELEELESEREDDDGITTEMYVDAGYEAVEAFRKSSIPERSLPLTPSPIPQEKNDPAAPPATVTLPPLVAPPQTSFPNISAAATVPPASSSVVPVAQETAMVPVYSGAKNRQASRGSLSGALVWRHSDGTPGEVARTMRTCVNQARQSSGIVKFIEQPRPGLSEETVSGALASISRETLFVDLGTLPVGISIHEAISLFWAASGLKPPEELVDWNASLTAGGKSRSSAALASRNAKDMLELGTIDRPLVIVARGTDAIARSTHRLFLELAKRSIKKPFCGFLFFYSGNAPSWHVLATLNDA
jgi:serine/threonine protein kinase